MNPNSSPEDSNKLLRLLGVGFGVAATVGGTIGTGILRKPGPIAEHLGNPTLIMLVWLLIIGYPFVPIILIVLSVLFLVGALYEDFQSGVFAIGFLIISYPLYWLTKKWNAW